MPALNLETGGDAVANAYTLAHLAEAAYADAPADDSSFQKTVFSTAVTFADVDTETQGFVTANADHLVVAFRGTDQVRDWLTNITARMEAGFGGKVHAGFAAALDSVWADVEEHLSSLRDNGQTVWVTGHSLGGALATLAAKRLAVRPHATMTFGQPRVGDRAFASAFKPVHVRFVNNKDIVPTVPPRFIPGAWPPAFYTHVGDLRFFSARGKLTARRGELGIMPELVELLGPLSNREADARELIIDGMRDHKIGNYIACLAKNLPG